MLLCNGPQVNTLAFFNEVLQGAVMCFRSGAESVNLFTRPMRLLRSVRFVGAGKSVIAFMNFWACLVPSPFMIYRVSGHKNKEQSEVKQYLWDTASPPFFGRFAECSFFSSGLVGRVPIKNFFCRGSQISSWTIRVD